VRASRKTADRAGIEFMLPIGRWKGYGGDTDYQGETWETVTWACGLLAKTERLTVLGTVPAPLIPPLIAAKEFVTADDIGEGRFGVNVVCGWRERDVYRVGSSLCPPRAAQGAGGTGLLPARCRRRCRLGGGR
jgi:alkanesulfonate monooxygenase SsuD/methylene tetrahydromethanopterin reductase-like flavin-dependent oxidoreductase (luciferase family)